MSRGRPRRRTSAPDAALARDAVEQALLDGGRGRRDLESLGARQQRRAAREPLVLGGARRAARQVRGDGVALLGLERAEHVAAQLVADVGAAHDGTTPISSRTSRSERSAYQVRLLTVPSGSPV